MKTSYTKEKEIRAQLHNDSPLKYNFKCYKALCKRVAKYNYKHILNTCLSILLSKLIFIQTAASLRTL